MDTLTAAIDAAVYELAHAELAPDQRARVVSVTRYTDHAGRIVAELPAADPPEWLDELAELAGVHARPAVKFVG